MLALSVAVWQLTHPEDLPWTSAVDCPASVTCCCGCAARSPMTPPSAAVTNAAVLSTASRTVLPMEFPNYIRLVTAKAALELEPHDGESRKQCLRLINLP